jgi:hypothetical protein
MGLTAAAGEASLRQQHWQQQHWEQQERQQREAGCVGAADWPGAVGRGCEAAGADGAELRCRGASEGVVFVRAGAAVEALLAAGASLDGALAAASTACAVAAPACGNETSAALATECESALAWLASGGSAGALPALAAVPWQSAGEARPEPGWSWHSFAAGLAVDVFVGVVVLSFLLVSGGDGEHDYDMFAGPQGEALLSVAGQQQLSLRRVLSRLGEAVGSHAVMSPRLLYPTESESEPELHPQLPEAARAGTAAGTEAEAEADATPAAADKRRSGLCGRGAQQRPCRRRPRSADTAIVAHLHLSCMMRTLVPALLTGAIGLFLYGAFECGSSVTLQVSVGSRHLPPIVLTSDLTLGVSLRKMASAGVYPLFVLTLLTSGLWPYLRQLLLMGCLLLPPRHLSVGRRAALLHLLDVLGKFVFINTVFSYMMGAAFGFKLSTDTVAYLRRLLPKHYVVADVVLAPNMEVYNLAATLSMIAGHLLIALHRNAIAYDLHCELRGEGDVEAVHSTTTTSSSSSTAARSAPAWIRLGGRNCSSRESVSAHSRKCKGARGNASQGRVLAVQLAVLVCVLTAIAATVYGCSADTFGFTFKGLVGKLIGAIDPQEVQADWSIIGMIRSAGAGRGGQEDGARLVIARMMQALLAFLAIGAPVLHLFLLAALWWLPLTLTEQKVLYAVQEAVGAWASLDVYLVALLSSLSQMPTFARYLVGDACPASLDCFDVQAFLLNQAAAIMLAVLSWYAAAWLVTSRADHAILHREAFFVIRDEQS